MKGVTVKAFAKVNLYLEVTGKREDGYHSIETLYHGIHLHDLVSIEAIEAVDAVGAIEAVEAGGAVDAGIRLELETDDAVSVGAETRNLEAADAERDATEVANTNADGEAAYKHTPANTLAMPLDQRNLVWIAAELLRSAYPDRVGGVRIRLQKRIPLEAGLAGGSADAAATLLGINELYGLGLSLEELRAYAARIGSDVPFCLQPLAAIGRGRGEALEPIQPLAPQWILLVKPPFGMSTKDVYAAWGGYHQNRRQTGEHTAPKERLDLLLRGAEEHALDLIWANMGNDLEGPAMALDPRLDSYKAWILRRVGDCACGKVLLSGSGSTFAVFFTDEASARQAEGQLRESPGPAGAAPQIIRTRMLMASDLIDQIRTMH